MSDVQSHTTDVILDVRGVHRQYQLLRNKVSVLRGIDLTVQTGERLSIMGASGAGKSTLLYIMGGLDRPTSGSVIYQGRDLFSLSASQRTELRGSRFGFVFQAYHLLPELDLLQNVLLPVMRHWNWLTNAAEYRKRAMELLERVGLQDRIAHRPVELSGGEQQRAAIARALMNKPDLLLADEPTGNLDSQMGDQVLQCLFELSEGHHHTLVLVTHNEAVAAQCDRTIVLHDGQVA